MKSKLSEKSLFVVADTLCLHIKKNISTEVTFTFYIDNALAYNTVTELDQLSGNLLMFATEIQCIVQKGELYIGLKLEKQNILSIHVRISNAPLEQIRESQLASFCSTYDKGSIQLRFPLEVVQEDSLILKRLVDKKALLIGPATEKCKKESLSAFFDSLEMVESGGDALEILFNNNNFDILFMAESVTGISTEVFSSLLKHNEQFEKLHVIPYAEEQSQVFLLELASDYFMGKKVQGAIRETNSLEHIVFDQNALYERTGGNSSFMMKIISLYCKDMEKHLKVLENDEEDEVSSIQRIAHSMKGASYSCCALKMAQHAKELEMVVKTKGIAGITVLVDGLRGTFEEFKKVVAPLGYLKKEN